MQQIPKSAGESPAQVLILPGMPRVFRITGKVRRNTGYYFS